MEDLLLDIQHIHKSYAKHQALKDVSIHVPKNSIFGLLGPNGAGKTSLIRIINQITAPDEGKVLFDNEPLSARHIKEIGYLPEERGLYKKMKVGEQALYLAQLKGMGRKEALSKLKDWFTRFDIIDWWDKRIEELSKGMQQKIQFITTVLHQPRLLILDEPFSGFDPINTNLIKKEILSLRQQGATVIFSTHNMASVEEICDHIALINKSEKILEGSVVDVRNRFKRDVFDIGFSGNNIAFTNALWTGAELIRAPQGEGPVLSARIQLSEGATINQVLQNLLPVVEIKSINEHVPSMNEIFIEQVTEIKASH